MGTGFYKLPAALFNDNLYSDLSLNAKVLYALLLDRMELSDKRNWRDGQSIYVIFTIAEIQKYLGCSKGTAVSTLAELEEHLLVHKKKRGRGEADLLFVKPYNFAKKKVSEGKESASRSSKIEPLEVQESDQSEVQNLNPIYTDTNNQTDNNKSLSTSNAGSNEREADKEYDKVLAYLRERVGYETLSSRTDARTKEALPIIDEILSLVTDTLVSDTGTIRISGQDKSMSVVSAALMKMDGEILSEVYKRLTQSHVRLSRTPDAVRKYVVAVAYDVCSSYKLSSLFMFNRELGDYDEAAVL